MAMMEMSVMHTLAPAADRAAHTCTHSHAATMATTVTLAGDSNRGRDRNCQNNCLRM